MKVLSTDKSEKKEMFLSMSQCGDDINFHISDRHGNDRTLAFWISSTGIIRRMDGVKKELEDSSFDTSSLQFHSDGSIAVDA